MSSAFFAGSFDPFTVGHRNIVERGLKIFDQVVVAVADHPTKKYWFSMEARKQMVCDSLADLDGVTVVTVDGSRLTAHVAKQNGCSALLRGFRGAADMEVEIQLAVMNRLLGAPETVLLTPEGGFTYISSTTVRNVALLGGEIKDLVHPNILERVISQAFIVNYGE